MPLQYSEILSGDLKYTVDLTEVIHCAPVGDFKVAQGAATDGKFAYFALRQSGDGNAVICKYDLATGERVAVSDPIYCGHANDLTYDSAKGLLYIAHGQSEGFMKKLMNMAIDDMVADGVVLSVLGGRRQRYNYFSYDKLGPVFAMSFNSDNIRHTFGADRKPFFSFVKVDGKDQSVLDSIKALSESKPLYAIRDREKYYEILVSWRMAVYEILREEKFAGYCIVDDTSVYEILLLPEFEDKFAFCVRDLFDHLGRGSLRVKLPLYLDGYISQIAAIGESYSVDTAKSFSVLNFRKVCSAFMKLKATYSKLPDGELCLSIDGRGGREKILRCRGR